MEKTGVAALAKLLKWTVTVVFVCNILVLLFLPSLVAVWLEGSRLPGLWELIVSITASVYGMLLWGGRYEIIVTVFFFLCGVCTAVTLWQARGVLDTIVKGNTFTMQNALRMKRAACCMFCISGAALLRTIWGFFYVKAIQPLFTYNTLFCPVFLVAGLFCMVMSALFRQAAELKEESDLTI